jgi:hypothetical protein
MTALAGRHIYITDLKRMLAGDAPSAFVQRCRRAQLAGVWIRIGRGKGKDPNMTLASLDAVRDQLAFAGIELWGWHVPFCEDREAAKAEAAGFLNLPMTRDSTVWWLTPSVRTIRRGFGAALPKRKPI